MYPANYYALFPPFPRKNAVFVAMSFASELASRWQRVIEPAIRAISVDGVPMDAVRVDARVVSDSILTEILTGIGTCRVFFADVTSAGFLDNRPVRNGNVMYEVGIAHAIRLPEEVILFRSDHEQLLFDTANVRVNNYSPDSDSKTALRQVEEAIVSAIREVDLRRNLTVQAVVDALDAASFEVLLRCQEQGKYLHPECKTMGQVLAAVSMEAAVQRLLTLGLLKVQYQAVACEQASTAMDAPLSSVTPYSITAFGQAALAEIAHRLNRPVK